MGGGMSGGVCLLDSYQGSVMDLVGSHSDPRHATAFDLLAQSLLQEYFHIFQPLPTLIVYCLWF